ncbi:hypothetical protein SSX86_011157 [Deinandra increscens subsp. villosa]|uniref:Uncharacterized protein n=1 Tax=Deinandra increscens subsp. villosa TaxID=3103831 RepID=A0AAP0H5K3_9ASTR
MKQLCIPIKDGGLGLKPLEIRNLAMIGKWYWRYKTDESGLWKKVVDGLHGNVSGQELVPVHRRGQGVWCSISMVDRLLLKKKVNLKELISQREGV